MTCRLIYVLGSVLFIQLTACREPAGKEYSPKIIANCQKWETPVCEEGCKDGIYRYCYIDKKYANEKFRVRDHCYAVHVGRTCQPCENLFALNFGGALTPVKCQEFFQSIEDKNKKCDNCLMRLEDLS